MKLLDEVSRAYGDVNIFSKLYVLAQAERHQNRVPRVTEVLKRLLPNDKLRDVLQRAVKVRLQNVADYFFVVGNKDMSLEEDFPRLTPPWPIWWAEWIQPKVIRMSGDEMRLERQPRVGVLVLTPEFPDLPELNGGTHIRWVSIIVMWVWHEQDRGSAPSIVQTLWALDAQGKMFVLWREGHQTGPSMSMDCDARGDRAAVYPMVVECDDAEDRVGLVSLAHFSMRTLALAISFCHCSNVEIVTTPIDSALQRKRERVGKVPITSWKVLNIGSISRAVNAAMKGNALGLKQALHMCRGHFKDYGAKGLFGKLKGTYWWNMQLRGTKEVGVANKDYNVQVPMNKQGDVS